MSNMTTAAGGVAGLILASTVGSASIDEELQKAAEQANEIEVIEVATSTPDRIEADIPVDPRIAEYEDRITDLENQIAKSGKSQHTRSYITCADVEKFNARVAMAGGTAQEIYGPAKTCKYTMTDAISFVGSLLAAVNTKIDTSQYVAPVYQRKERRIDKFIQE